jgi:hypothetical protein
MTRREFVQQVNERMANAIISKSGGELDDEMTMADYGVASMEMSDFAAEHRGEFHFHVGEEDT